ncbi:MAG: PAS domain S-box protein [Haloferacaceae archaeon]
MTDRTLNRPDGGDPHAGTIRVLHVDDDPDFAELTAEFLEREDDRMEVVTATSASEGLDRLAEDGVDCIVSDYDMPRTNGLEFLDAVRDEYGDRPFVLFTGKGSEEVASEAITAGVTDYLQKEGGTDQYTLLANRVRNAVEQHRSKRAVEETERKLVQLAEKTDDVLFMFDGDWEELLFVNSAYEEVWGASIDELEADPRSFLDYVHPDDRRRAEASLARLTEGRPSEVEYRVVLDDGETRWVRGETRPIRDDDGTVARIAGSVRDVTARKRREERLQLATARLEALFDDSPDMMDVHDADGTIVDVNRRICEELGYAESELLGTSVWEIDRAVGPDELRATLSGMETGETMKVDGRFERRDGSTFPVAVHLARLDLEGEDRFLVTSRDVTDRAERKRRIEALHVVTRDLMGAESPEAIAEIAVAAVRDVLDIPVTGCWLYDESEEALDPVAVTDEANVLVGEHPTYEPGEGLSWTAFERGELAVYDDLSTVEGTANPETSIRSEIVVPLGDHGVLNVGSPEPDAFGETDVSLARILGRNVEAALVRADRERELARRNERLAEFASIVSHDLQNPLNVLDGSLDLAEETGDPEQFARSRRAVDRMQTLIDDLLVLAREGESVGTHEAVDLRALAEDCWAAVETGDATLRVEADSVVRCDPGRCRQLLANLFRNSVEHGSTGSRTGSGDSVEHDATNNRTQSGDPVGTASTGEGTRTGHADRKPTVTVGDLDDGAGFYVADDGPGVPEADRERVFDRGYSTSDGGTGFGLAIVERVADAHGWDVRLTESDDGGARFEVTGVDVVE